MWQVLMGSLGKPSVAILVGRAVTVFTFATCYIIFGSPDLGRAQVGTADQGTPSRW